MLLHIMTYEILKKIKILLLICNFILSVNMVELCPIPLPPPASKKNAFHSAFKLLLTGQFHFGLDLLCMLSPFGPWIF